MKRLVLGVILAQLIFASVAQAATRAVVNGIRVSSVTKRLVIEVDRPFKYRSFTLGDPDRLVIDIVDARLSRLFHRASFTGTPILKMRSGVQHGDDLRLVFDLKSPIQKHDFALMGGVSHRSRLVVDWAPKGQSFGALGLEPLAPKMPPPAPEPKLSAKKRAYRDMVIVLDPGHGGKDPGAIGKRGTREKAVVMKIADLVKHELVKSYGVRVILTRKGDYYVPLRDRTKFARRGDADLFVSIHADAYQEGHSSGASVYALSPRGASSEAARWLADRENYSELGGVDLNELQDSSDVLRTMLLDLSQTATIASSIHLGSYILQSLKHVVLLHKRKVEQAPFVVLKSPDIPSLLVEVGFISNLREERELKSGAHQRKVAGAIAKGIVEYALHYAPDDTHFAQHYRKEFHKYA